MEFWRDPKMLVGKRVPPVASLYLKFILHSAAARVDPRARPTES